MTYPVITLHHYVHGYITDDDPTKFTWKLYYGVDYSSQEDITVIKHSVSCCRCGNNELLEFQNASDFIYFDDNMKELGWEKDKYGRWFCDECSYKGGDD